MRLLMQAYSTEPGDGMLLRIVLPVDSVGEACREVARFIQSYGLAAPGGQGRVFQPALLQRLCDHRPLAVIDYQQDVHLVGATGRVEASVAGLEAAGS